MSRQPVDTTGNQIDRKTAAAILSISQRTLDRYIRQNLVYSRKVNRRVWLDKEDILRFKEKLESELLEDVNSMERPHRDANLDSNYGIISSRQSRHVSRQPLSTLSTQDPVEGEQKDTVSRVIDEVLHNDKNQEDAIINMLSRVVSPHVAGEHFLDRHAHDSNSQHISTLSSIPTQTPYIQGGMTPYHSESIYQKLYEELKKDFDVNQKRIEAANYKVGQLEAKIETMVPELEFKRQQTKFRELETGLKIQVKKRELQLKKARTMLNSERLNKWIFAITALALIGMQPIIWLMQN